MNEFDFKKEESVLLIGEGNFTFCYAILERYRNLEAINLTNFFATCFEEEESSVISLNIKENLLNAGVKILFAVDARKLSTHPVLGDKLFNKILFNFPHVGGKMKIHLNRQLLQDFFVEASAILDDRGEIIVTLCAGQGGTPADKVERKWADSWQIVEMAARAGLVLTKTRSFPFEFLNTYISVGYRGKVKSFNTQGAVVHIFRITPPLLMNVDDIVSNNKVLHLVDGVLMPYEHKNKIICNPYKDPSSPQSYVIKILEESCRKFVSDDIVTYENPLSNLSSSSDKKDYLRNHLLHSYPNKRDYKHYLVKDLCFNDFTGNFTIAPAECHAAVFGTLSTEIINNFICNVKNIFNIYLCIDGKDNMGNLEANNWFILQDETQSGIDINVDRLLVNIFNVNWRQLWCPEITIQDDNCHPLLIPPSIHSQSFLFDITFRVNNSGPLDIKHLLITVQEINCDIIESVNLLNQYYPKNYLPTYCFRFVYKSYYWALCRKTAIAYHNLIGKAIEQLLNVQIV